MCTLDCDAKQRPDTIGIMVYAVRRSSALTKGKIIEKYPAISLVMLADWMVTITSDWILL